MEGIVLQNGIERMDFEKVTKMLANSYWCPGIKIEEVKKGANNSALVVGAFLLDEQVGFARVVSDKIRFAYILDAYVDKNYRKREIGQKMMKYILSHDDFKDVDIWLLITNDAHGFYCKVGFKLLSDSLSSLMMVIDKKDHTSINMVKGFNKYLC